MFFNILNKKFLLFCSSIFVLVNSAFSTEINKTVWNTEKLFEAPKIHEVPDWTAEGVKSIMFDSLDYKEKSTRVFAWYSIPDHKDGEKVPGIVLVHGGGGTAFDQWVRIWNSWGYAAIAMDLRGQVPRLLENQKRGARQFERHNWAGPPQTGIFNDYNEPRQDRWIYHAVANVILANSLLRSLDQVDPNRIGITGISWGGIITSVVVGVDDRFAFAVPVYGCGFLYESDNHYEKAFDEMPLEKNYEARYLWDGSNYISKSKMPMLWLNGINDRHFYPMIFQKSYLLAKDRSILCFKPDIGHDHPQGWNNKEIRAFADSVVKGGKKLINVCKKGICWDGTAWAKYQGPADPQKAQLIYTLDNVVWEKRKWKRQDAQIKSQENIITAAAPENATAYFFIVYDDRGLITSSQMFIKE